MSGVLTWLRTVVLKVGLLTKMHLSKSNLNCCKSPYWVKALIQRASLGFAIIEVGFLFVLSKQKDCETPVIPNFSIRDLEFLRWLNKLIHWNTCLYVVNPKIL